MFIISCVSFRPGLIAQKVLRALYLGELLLLDTAVVQVGLVDGRQKLPAGVYDAAAHVLFLEPGELDVERGVGHARGKVEARLRGGDLLHELERKGGLARARPALDDERTASGLSEELRHFPRDPALAWHVRLHPSSSAHLCRLYIRLLIII
jgi:hypothetical protein